MMAFSSVPVFIWFTVHVYYNNYVLDKTAKPTLVMYMYIIIYEELLQELISLSPLSCWLHGNNQIDYQVTVHI